jgi:hypothetical protein
VHPAGPVSHDRGLQTEGTRSGSRSASFIEDQRINASTSQVAGKSKSRGAGTGDQNSRILHSKLVRGSAPGRSHFDLSIVVVSRSIFVQCGLLREGGGIPERAPFGIYVADSLAVLKLIGAEKGSRLRR